MKLIVSLAPCLACIAWQESGKGACFLALCRYSQGLLAGMSLFMNPAVSMKFLESVLFLEDFNQLCAAVEF